MWGNALIAALKRLWPFAGRASYPSYRPTCGVDCLIAKSIKLAQLRAGTPQSGRDRLESLCIQIAQTHKNDPSRARLILLAQREVYSILIKGAVQ